MSSDPNEIPVDIQPEPSLLTAKLEQLEKQVADYKLLIADFENAPAYALVNSAAGDGPTLTTGAAAVLSALWRAIRTISAKIW